MALETLLTNDGVARDLGAEGARRVEAFDLASVAARFLSVVPS
jgi:hypothetical protein